MLCYNVVSMLGTYNMLTKILHIWAFPMLFSLGDGGLGGKIPSLRGLLPECRVLLPVCCGAGLGDSTAAAALLIAVLAQFKDFT